MENECIEKKFQECHTKDFFYQEHKRNLFLWEFFFDVNF
jgi:hypothetical protein